MKKNTLNHHDTSDNASTFVYASPSANGGGLKRSTLINSTALPTRNFSPGFGGAVLSSSSFSPSASATAATHGTTAGITPLLPIHSDYTPWPVSTSMASASDTVESECLEHYEHNLEKYKDERDRVQKKTFTKWVNKHLTKSGRHVNDLFCDLRDGFNLIALLEALSDEILHRENGQTRFHRIQNIQYCLDFLRKKHIKLVNIRPEDIVEGNGKLTLGLIWTIILNFQVSLINQRRQIQQQQLRRLTEIVHHRQVATKTTKGTSVTGAAANGANSGATANGALSTSSSAYSSYSTRKISESAYQFNDGISARDALLQWAKKVTSGYSGVSVNNFTNSWKDGRAFNAILHFYKPTAVNWEKISDKSVSNRERLRHAFDAFEKEFGISKLLDPEDVDVDNPDEKSIITYVSSLYNTLCHDEASQDSLIAFIRAAQQELVWIHDREIIEVARNWSDINQLDLPMLQNYFRQLLHEIEIREKQFNDVHNQGAALINQRHPASDVIEVYLRTMQSQWDWLLNLSKCLEGHLRDALNLKAFMEESEQVEQWMQRQIEHLEQSYNRTDFSLEEGERYLRELDDIRELNNKYHAHLMQLTDRCSQISPLWQRGERISKPIVVTAFCDYKSREITIRQGSECTLLDNNDLVQWRVRSSDGYEAEVPSVVFRVPPPDPRLTIYLRELAAQFERLRKLWDKKHRQVRYNMVLNTMKTVRGWDLNTFMAIPPEQRDEIIKALNDDAMKLLSELDPNDPLALRLKEELALTNDHFYNLLNSAQKGPESEYSNKYDDKMAELLRKLDDAWKQLNDRVGDNIATNIEELERNIHQHKNFEDALQALDVDVSNVKELFRQLPDPTPSQRANYELLSTRWEDLWDLSRMYVERLKALESVLQGLDEVTDIVRRHEITLSSFDDLPSALDKLRGVHSQLIELNMVLQQQQEYVQALNKNVALLRQHVARTRFDAPGHPDVDRLEDEVQKITVRWDNVCSQVSERLRIAEEAQQSQMIYRSQYDEEILWLDRVEETINSLRRPEDLRPEELQAQLDQLVAEYAQLQEHTATIENINKEGGKFIREAKSYDLRLSQYHDGIVNIHGPQVKSEIRREIPQQKNGAQIVTEELEALNRRFAQLSSVILERKNIVNVLIQNWKRKQQDVFYGHCTRCANETSSLLSELRNVQREQEDFHFDFGSINATNNARSQFSKIRNNLASYASRIEENILQTERLCEEGVETLSPEQFHSLKESQQKLRCTYENILKRTDAVLDRLDLATALLIEFSTKSSLLQSWILEKASEISALRRRSGDYRRLAESRRALKVLDEEIERHAGSELIAIGELAVKINDEICNYMEELRRKEITAVRVSSQIHHQQINQTVDRIQDDYAALIRSKTELLQFLDRLKSLASQHEERLSTVTNWLADLEESMDDSQLANVSTEKRLEMLTKLQNTAMDRQYCISELNGTTHSLINSVANTDTYDSVKAEHKKIVENVEERYARIIKRVDAELSAVRAVKTQRESLQRGVMELTQWLEDANDKMLSAQPLPLDLAKLKDFKFENKTKHKELDTKMKTLEGLKRLMDQMRNNASDIVEAENLDERVEQAGRRLRRFNSCVGALDRNVDDLIDALTQIQEKNATFMNEQASLSNTIGILDIGDGEAVSAVEERLSRLVDNDWSELETLARRIIQIPGVENTKFVDDLVKNAEIGLNQLSDELSQRKEGATNTRERLIALNKEVVCVLDEMEKLRCAEVFTLPATTNIEELRRRQATILHHKDVELRQIGERVDVLSSACKELIRSGSPGVSAKDPELLMERVSTSWQDLNALVANHERRIDVALQSLGGYAEAHAALLQWLEQTEVLFVEQQAPSADYKVVRAQLQNHNFQAKLVTEKAASVQGFMSMVENLKPLNNEQKLQLQEKADEISSRYNNLVLAAENRRKNLTRTQDFTLEFSQLTQTLSKFLEEANKALQVFGKIPTDAEKLEEQVQFQMELQEQIDEMRPDFERLTDLYAELVQLVGVEDVNELDVTVRSLTSRYNEVGQRCRNCGQLLTELAKDISNFIENTNQLTDWLDSTENEIKKYGEISTLPDELVQQSEELTKLAIAVAEQSALVSQVVEESRELCTHTSGGEAIALQYRIDCLRQRYSQLATEAEAKIAALSKAIPLSEELRDGFQELTDFLNGVEEDLNNLDQVSWEEQMQIIETIVTDMEQFRTQFDDLQAMCVDLQRLSGEAKANELAKKSQEMLVRFNSVNDTATRKAEQLKSAERQSRYTFDALNFWIDWFNETRDAISNAEKPSVDMEFLRAQLKQQRVLNDEIANERVGLRNVIADASRIARNLSNTSFASPENGLIAKIEKTKKLAEETADAGLERTAALEQAFVLCRELDESYTELSEWMDETEKVLQNCDAITTGMSAKTLMQQQIHNNSMLQTVQSQRPLISKFERNIGTLSELCSEVDAANLQQIFDQVVERYNELAGAFRERGDALESTIEQSSEFADRFNVFLSNLQGALNQLRHAEAASAHPVVLQQQIADNQEIIELIKQKEDAFRTMKSNAQEVLLQARNDGPAVRDIAQNIEVLDDLWSELQSGSTARHNLLSECLRRAEEFWHDYEHCQGVLAALNVDVEAVHANGAAAAPNDNASDAWRRDRLADVEANLRDAAAVYVERMRAGGVQLCELLNDIDERMYVQQHLALFDANWTAFSQMFAHLSAQLNSTSDMLARFNESHASLNTWLNDAEERIANFAPKTPAVNEEIREELAAVNAIRHELDANALQREHLSNLGAEICAGAPTAQVSFVRSALGELTQRWNRMSVQLAERFQRLERALLDMGQFRQAYDQFVIWMEHTQAALDTMTAAARPTSLKYAEIELCKFRVLQNDIYAHQPSYEAILRAGKALIRDGDGGLATNREGDADSADGGATNASTNAAIDALAERWQRLIENAERLRVMLEAAHNAVGERSAHLDEWTLWLADVLAELKTTRPVGGLPETAAAQLDDFRVLAADVEQRRSKFEKELDRLAKHLAAESDDSSDASDKEDHGDGGDKLPQKFDDGALLKRQYAQLKRDWDNVQLKLLEREAKLIDALRQAIDLQDGVNEISDWLTDAGNALSLAPTISRIPDVLRQQMDEHARFNDEVQAKRERLKELHNNGVRIQLVCEKKDAIPMKNKLISLKHAMEKIVQRSVERARLLDNAFAEAEIFFTEYEKLTRFAEMGLQRLEAAAGASSAANNTGCRLRDQLAEHRVFRDEIQRRSSVFEAAQQRGRLLEEHALASEKKTIAEANERLREKWQALEAKSLNRQKSLDEALAQSGKFDEVMAEMTAWLDATLAALEAEDRIGGCCGDVDTVHALLDEHYANVMEPLKTRLPNLNILRERAAKMLSTARATDVEKRDDNDAELSNIRAQMAHVDAQWERLTAMANRRDESLSNALTKAVDLSEMLHEFQNFVADIETKIRRIPVPAEETPVLQELKRVEELRDVVRHQADNVEKILGLARDIQTNSHKRADLAMRELIRSVTGRWELIHQLIVDKNDKLNSRLEAIREHEKQLRLLSEFIEEKRAELAMMANSDDQGQLDRLSALVGELGMFKATLRERQTEVDEARRFMKRTSAPIVQIQAPVTTVDPPSGKQHTTLKKLSASTPTTPTKSPHAKIDAKQPSRSARQQRTEEMAEAWTTLWSETDAYEARLAARRAHLEELKRLEAFTFDEWRERYLAWNDHGKARISDLFRRIDKSGTGVVPRKLFIDGILASKFPTTELEMGKVADEFDKGDGHISAKEFMNALRYDPKKRNYKPKTETERIHEEIARETSRCTCAHRFPIQHISSDDNDNRVQYGFGFGNTMKRMVRILRSTVMVRVGGGWEALDEFLLKHDPCRAKGRLNVELLHGEEYRSSFGSTDHMASFTPRKNSASSSSQVSTPGTSGHRLGPIMKIREKTERSMPMFKKPTTPKSPSSNLFSTPFQQPRRRGSDDLILNDNTRIPRPASTAASSRSSSRQNLASLADGSPNSRPASRCGSDASGFSRISSFRGMRKGSSGDPLNPKASSPLDSQSHL